MSKLSGRTLQLLAEKYPSKGIIIIPFALTVLLIGFLPMFLRNLSIFQDIL